MQRFDIDAAADAPNDELVAPGRVHAVLIVHVRASRWHGGHRHAGKIGERAVHRLGVTSCAIGPFIQQLQPGEADGRLHVREAFGVRLGERIERADVLPQINVRVSADERRDPENRERAEREHVRADEQTLEPPDQQPVLDAFAIGPRLALGQRPDARRDRGILDEGQAPAIAVERLQRLEAEEACVAQRANRPSVVRRTERVRAVFDHAQVVPRGDPHDRIHVARQAVQMSGHDRARVWRDRAFQSRGIEGERGGIDVCERDLEPGHARQLGDDPERQRRHDDLGAGGEIERLQDVVERHAAVGSRDGLCGRDTGTSGERRLEPSDVGALDELATGFAVRDDLFGVGSNARTVARDGRQHHAVLAQQATGREMSAISSRVWRSLTRRSMRLTHSRTAPF